MPNNMDDLLANVKKMVDSGNIPDDIKNMMNNVQNQNNNSQGLDLNNIMNQISPEMLNNFSNMMNSNNQSSDSSSNNFNLDVNTIMKMKSVIDNMNNKNDPRANLLYSLKPYLRDSKKSKLDQYVNLLNISKMADVMNKNKDDKNE